MDIIIKYSCTLCGIYRRHVSVPQRENEDVRIWMNMVTHRLADDHKLRSPNCRATKLDEVMIPITGADKIGGAPVH
jgi:hypothetical protein